MDRFGRGLAILALAAVFGLAVTNHFVCPFAAVTGIPCPGCGMTRALLALARGDWRAAWQQHPVGLLVPPLTAVLGGVALQRWREGRASGRPLRGAELLPSSPLLWGGLAALLLVVWILRLSGVAGELPSIPHTDWKALFRLAQ